MDVLYTKKHMLVLSLSLKDQKLDEQVIKFYFFRCISVILRKVWRVDMKSTSQKLILEVQLREATMNIYIRVED